MMSHINNIQRRKKAIRKQILLEQKRTMVTRLKSLFLYFGDSECMSSVEGLRGTGEQADVSLSFPSSFVTYSKFKFEVLSEAQCRRTVTNQVVLLEYR
jgi:hypothetical protein